MSETISETHRPPPRKKTAFNFRINRKPSALFESKNARRERLRNKQRFDQAKTLPAPPTPPPLLTDEENLRQTQFQKKCADYRTQELRRQQKKEEALARRQKRPWRAR